MHVDPYASLERQWNLLRLIPAAPQAITVAALLVALRDARQRASRRTVARDLHELSVRFPITVDDSGKTHRWSWAKAAQIDFLPRLNVPQCLALAVVRKHMRTLLPGSVLADLDPLFDAAERELAQSGWKDWPARIAVAAPAFALLPPKIDAKVLFEVQHAIVRRVQLTANYRSIGKPAARRSIHPLGLLLRGSLQYLVALVPEHPEPVQLALQRMSEPVVGTEPCTEPHGFSMRKYARDRLAIHPRGKIRLRCLFDETTAEHVAQTPISKYQTWRKIEGTGKVEVSATVEDDKQLKRWLLSFGPEVEVLAPERLRREMMEALGEARRAYGG